MTTTGEGGDATDTSECGENKTYAEFLNDDVFLILRRGSDGTAFTAKVEKAVLGLKQVKKEKQKATLKIRDMDSEATEKEARTAIGGALRKPDDYRKDPIKALHERL
ncbi:hypothetical protein TSAR_002677 [Trichomalopsis sarcophagae]|uniref:Uncharacterized protein n=1 Tax=Trichomalopsis sarcophagae TaxID=543379 RepID=A0A232EWX9_9HYME|nr:hypothetical protein TSAR_002677 [Trichomalopsis sarcophagae]